MIDKEILDGFKEESNAVLTELVGIVEKIEETTDVFPEKLLQDFSQRIDRIMGAAKTLAIEEPNHQGLRRMGAIAELCKFIGYKAAEKKQIPLLPIFAAFLSDSIAVVQDLLDSIEDENKTAQITKDFSPVLQKRLEWLKKKVTSESGAQSTQAEIDKILESMK